MKKMKDESIVGESKKKEGWVSSFLSFFVVFFCLFSMFWYAYGFMGYAMMHPRSSLLGGFWILFIGLLVLPLMFFSIPGSMFPDNAIAIISIVYFILLSYLIYRMLLFKFKSEKKIVAIIVIATVLLIGLDYLTMDPYSGGTSAQDFERIKPQLMSLSVNSDGSFHLVFTNGAGATINIISASAVEKLSESNCHLVLEDPKNNSITPGNNLMLIGENCHTLKAGEPFNLEVTINYMRPVEGIPEKHIDTGTIWGKVD
ncbi:MAG: hypothetical protein ABH950_04415 [Candidatus Altiarchaeota archaeon]